jgi:hypothetical protein
LLLFVEMKDLSLAAKGSREVGVKIYEASEKARASPAGAQSGVQDDWTWPEDQFWPFHQDMDWFSLPEFGDFTFGTGFLAAGTYDQGVH